MKQSFSAVCAAILLVAGLVVGNSLFGDPSNLTCGLSAPGLCDVRELYRAVEHAPVTDDSEARALILMALGQVRTVNKEAARGIDKVYQGADVETSACVRSVLLETINEHASVYVTVGNSRHSWDLAVAAASSSSLSEARKNYLSVARSKVGGSADVLLGGSYAARVNNLQHCSSQHEAPIRADARPQILSSPAPTTVQNDDPVSDADKLSSLISLSASSADPRIGHNVARSASTAGASLKPSDFSDSPMALDRQQARHTTAGNAAAPSPAVSSSSTRSPSPKSSVNAAPELRKLGPAHLAAPAPAPRKIHPQARRATPLGKAAKPQKQQTSKHTSSIHKAKAKNGTHKAETKHAKKKTHVQKVKTKKPHKAKKQPAINKPHVNKKPPAVKKPHQVKPTKPKKPKQANTKPKNQKVPPGQQKKKSKAPSKTKNTPKSNSKNKPPGQQKKNGNKSRGKNKN